MPDPKRSDRLERLTNLVLVLIETGRPLSLREIASRVAGYPEGGEAARQAFERDKRALRDLNIPLSLETISGNEQVGYRIKPEEYYLPGLGIDEGEAQALAFAVASVRLGSAAGWSAIAKLGGPVSEAALERAGLGPSGGPHLGPVAVLPSLPLLGELHEAIRRRSVVAFSYRDRPRRVEPYVLHFRAGAWYLVGLELSAAGGPSVRTFRVDRMGDGISLSERDAFVAPEPSAIEEIRLMPWSAPRDAEALPIAELVIDARLSRSVAAQLPSGAQASFDEEGALRLSMPVSDEAAFVSFVAGLGDTAVLEGPQELRASLVAHLRLLAEPSPQERPGRDELEPAALPGRARRDAATEPGASQAHGLEGSGRHKRENARAAPSGLVAGERLRRLLAILVHLARVGDESLDELGERFSMSEDELVHELELAACCGVPPYSP
ncbi:MAG: WYL domain-containing protein, partial [Acidimicrobiales bacterium]